MKQRLRSIIVIVAAAIGPLQAQSTVSGVVAINNDRYNLNSVAAVVVPDSFDKSKTKVRTRVVLTDKPVPPDILDDYSLILDLKAQGYHGLEIEFSEDRALYSLSVISDTLQGSISTSGTFDGKKLEVFTKQRVAGEIEAKPEKIGQVTISYSVKFDTSVEPQDTPTAADTVAAASKESTKAYLALIAAIRAGDKQRLLDLSPPERRAAIESPNFPKAIQFLQSITPEKIDVLKAFENGDRAKLIVTGTTNGKSRHAKVYLSKVNGKWILLTESWSLD